MGKEGSDFGLITICGAGALGGNLVEFLLRQGQGPLRVVDCDRVEERNLATQPYREPEIGMLKVEALGHLAFDLGCDETLETVHHRLDPQTVQRCLRGSVLVVDCFDNAPSRQLVQDWCATQEIPCLHAGLSGDGYGEIRWRQRYQPGPGGAADVCANPLARSLVLMVVCVLAEVIAGYRAAGRMDEYAVTGDDLRISPLS